MFSERQLKSVAIAPKIASLPSILGSLFIIQHVLRSEKRRGRVYHRILLWMSLHDFLYSIKSFVSTWPIPEDYPFAHGAHGTTQTCTAAGFLGQGGSLTSALYNGSLTLFFLLVVKYGMKEDYIRRRVEPWLHAVPILIGWSTAIAGLPLKLYNAFGWTCWINSYPIGCIDNVDCQRGDNAGIYRWAFFHVELWAVFGFTLVAMFLIYQAISRQESNMAQYTFQPNIRMSSSIMVGTTTETNRKRSTNFAIQATFFVVIFFFTWFFAMLQTILSLRRDTLYFPLVLLSSISTSMQGFSNAIIYSRPRWIRYRKQHSNQPFRWQIFGIADPDETHRQSSGFSRLRNSFKLTGKVKTSEVTAFADQNPPANDSIEAPIAPNEGAPSSSEEVVPVNRNNEAVPDIEELEDVDPHEYLD